VRNFNGRKAPCLSRNSTQLSQDEEGDLKENVKEEVVRDLDAEITKGLEALKAGDAEEAEEFFTRVIRFSAHSARAYLHRAEARAAQDRHGEALEDVQTALAMDVSLGAKMGAFAMRANLRAEAGMLNEAESDFLKALEVARSTTETEKIKKQLQFLRAKMSGRAVTQTPAKPEVFTKVSIVEVDEEEEEEPKIVEIFDDDPAPSTATVKKRRVPVVVMDDE
jgi:tetratricopeptide (TPR) repeat protein